MENFLIGRSFWSKAETEQTGEQYRQAVDNLISLANGPWQVNDWGMDLGIEPTPVGPIASPSQTESVTSAIREALG